MKLFLVCALVSFSSVASAGDFSGPYVAADLGIRQDRSVDDAVKFHWKAEGSSRGAIASIAGGWLFQSGQIVYGPELGIDFRNSPAVYNLGHYFSRISSDSRASTDSPFSPTIKLRVGYVIGDTMLTMAAGAGASPVRSTFYLNPHSVSPENITSSTWGTTYVGDIGLMHKLTDRVILRALYGRTVFQGTENKLGMFTYKKGLDEHTFKIGLAFRL